MLPLDAKKDLLGHSMRLRYKTCDLKSKLTALMLYVEECDHLDEDKKNSILSLCEAIAERNQELITSENTLINTLDCILDGQQNEDSNSFLVGAA